MILAIPTTSNSDDIPFPRWAKTGFEPGPCFKTARAGLVYRENGGRGKSLRSARRRIAVAVAMLFIACGRLAAAEPPDTHRRIRVPLVVENLPAHAAFVPVSCEIDFTAILDRLKVPGAVDGRSLRLFRLLPDGREVEEPVQLAMQDQPRARQRRLLPDTTPKVSYLAEYAASAPASQKQAATLTWVAQADAHGRQACRLSFGVALRGRLVQVPYAPHELIAFDEQGRGAPPRYFARMQIRPQWPLDGVVHLLDHRELVTSYHTGPTPQQVASGAVGIRRPFLYPVNGPDGVSLTEFGKPHDPTGSHGHHYSLWVAHNKVGGQDFWSERGGTIAHEQFPVQEDGPICCRLVQNVRWMALGKDYLRERRSWTAYRSAGDFRLIDVDMQFNPPQQEPVELGQTSFGFLAVRVAQSMTPFDGGGEIVNARGDRNEQSAHLKHAEWIDLAGPVAPGDDDPSPARGDRAPAALRWNGVAVFDHPANAGYPTAWHCRNDGWAGASFNAEGPYTIRPGEPLHLRYRICLHRHDARRAALDRRFAEYAARPSVQVGEPAEE